MNFLMSWCTFTSAPKPTRDEMMRWEFSHGSVVWGTDALSAIEKLAKVDTKNFWSFETEPGIWDVQFDKEDEPLVMVVNVRAQNGVEAAKAARWFLHLDHQTEEIRRVT